MHTRPATRADLLSVVALCCAYDLAFRGAADTDETDLTDDWDRPGFSFDTATLVLEDDGRVVGWATVVEEHADAVVAQDRPELLPSLVDWLEAHPGGLEHYVPDADRARHALLAQRGWLPARRFWRMHRELTPPLPEPVLPAGVGVRPYRRPDDDVAVHGLITRCFREIGGQHERTLEDWQTSMLDSERFDAALYLVAETGGEVVGTCLSQQAPGDGFVRQLAVAPEARGQGLALALLHTSFGLFAGRGLPAAVLGVDAGNPTGALALYERAGLRVVEQFTRWDRPA